MTTIAPQWPPRRRYMLICGIRTDVENYAQNWNYRGERWLEDETDGTADCYTYHVGATTRWLKQKHHVETCAAVLTGRRRPNDSLILCGHSNGAEIARRVVVDNPAIGVSELHLIAPAVDDDFEKNGLNECVARGQIGRLFVYVSKADRALQKAKRYHWIRWLNKNWGYGALGLLGPKNVSPETARRMDVLDHPGFDHSDYFADDHFANTMRSIAGLDRPKGGTPPIEAPEVEWVPAVPPIDRPKG